MTGDRQTDGDVENTENMENDRQTDGKTCEICGKCFKTKYGCKRHKKSHEKRSEYSCNVCGLEFKRRDLCLKHQRKHESQAAEEKREGNEKPVIICKVCGQTFSSMNSFRVHKNKHLGKRYYCTRCAKSFTTTDQLKLHERDHDNVRSFQCSQCSSRFKRKSNLTRHMQQHEGTRRYVCHICGKAFVLNESLTTHMKVHETTPLFSCDICGTTYKYENSLKLHQKIHSNLKDFKCKICSREFLRKRTLEDHLKVHEKGTDRKALFVTPVEFCTLCSKGFASAYGLKRHMRKHRMGILKQYNRSSGKHLVSDPENSCGIKRANGPRKIWHHPKKVKVHSEIVDNGQLFEKIYPKSFMENSSGMTTEDKSQCEPERYIESNQDIKTIGSFSLTGEEHTPVMQSGINLAITSESDVLCSDNKVESDDLIFDDASCSSFEEIDTEMLGEHVVEDLIKMASLTDTFDETQKDAEGLNEKYGADVTESNESNVFTKDKENSDNTDFTDIEENFPKLTSNASVADDDSESQDIVMTEVTGCPSSKIIIERLDNANSAILGNTDKLPNEEATLFKQNKENNDIYSSGKSRESLDNSPSFVCRTCKKSKHFKNRKNFLSHMRKHHKGNTSCQFQCEKCLKIFYIKTDYEKHMKNEKHKISNCTGVLSLECKFCMTKYASIASLKMHLHRYHRDGDGEIYRCDQCKKMFASRILYKNHVDSHLLGGWKSREQCECDICGTRYRTRCSLRRHKRVTHGIEEDEEFAEVHNEENGEIIKYENTMEGNGQPLHSLSEGMQENLMEMMEQNQQENENVKPEYTKDESYSILWTEITTAEKTETVEWNIDKLGENSHIDNTAENDGKENIDYTENDVEHEVRTTLDESTYALDIEHDNTQVLNGGKETDNLKCYTDEVKETEKNSFEENDNRRVFIPSACETDGLKRLAGGPISYLNNQILNNLSTKERFQRKFQCIKCHKTFHMMSTLKQHMLTHEKQNKDQLQLFSCGQCDGKFSRKAQLMCHTHKFHSKFTLTCNYCPRKFTSVSCRKTHKCINLGNSKSEDKSKQEDTEKTIDNRIENHVCRVCNKIYAKQCCLQAHMCTHTGVYQCELCQASYSSEIHLEKHKLETHGNEVLDGDLQVDVRGHNTETPFKCTLCLLSLSSQNNLNRHLQLKHNDTHNDRAILATEKCDKCKEQSNLKHKISKKTFKCDSCNEAFRTNSCLKRHLRDAHNMYTYLCNKCPKSFSTYSNLKRHESINHSDNNKLLRNFMCSECGRCFTAKDSLRVHMFTHTGERPYKCSVCSAAYLQSSHLKRHIKVVHEGRLNYRCEYSGCGKSFYDCSVLRVHQRSHTDERPFSCSQCSSTFRTSNARNTHMKTHSLNKQFVCHICFQGLTTKHCLQKHLDRHAAAEKMNPSSAVYDPGFKVSLRQTIVKKMEEKRFGCSFCSRKFTTTRGVYAHQRKYCIQGNNVNYENTGRYYVLH